MSLYSKDDAAIPELDAFEEESHLNLKSQLSLSAKSFTEETSHVGSCKDKKLGIVVNDGHIDVELNSPNSMSGFERQRLKSNYQLEELRHKNSQLDLSVPALD